MFEMHDNGGVGYATRRREQPVRLRRRRVRRRAAEFQRQHGARLGDVSRCRGASATSVTYFYGSGNRFGASISATPYGKTGTNRLNLADTGGAGQRDHHPGVGSRPVRTGRRRSRRARSFRATRSKGLPLHKVDLRLTKDITLGGSSEGDADRRGLQPLQPRELRQLRRRR